jgi:hypothetical protein
MAAALSWEFPMASSPPPPRLTRAELDRKLEEYLETQEDDRRRRPALEKRFEQMTDTIVREISGLKSFVHDEIRGLKARVTIVEQKQERFFPTTDSGSWDIEKLKAEMELKLQERESARLKEKLEEEKSKPKGILAEFGPKILSHIIAAVLTGIIIYAIMHGVSPGH